MSTSAVVFLFDSVADGVPSWYGGLFDSAFLHALSGADPEGQTRSCILRGDALVAQLATKVTSVEEHGQGSSYVQSYDMEVYRTLIWDMADALCLQWNTIDPESFPLVLARRGVHCISVPTLPIEFRHEVDQRLRTTVGYLGAIEIDLGNPIQRKVFVEYLIKDAAIIEGQIVMELSFEGVRDSAFNGSAEFQPNGERYVDYGTLSTLRPAIPLSPAKSPRGQLSLERYDGKRKFSLQERVIAALANRTISREGKLPWAFHASADPRDPLEADLPESKFVRYLLDDAHPKGGPKAKFFSEALGIGPDDWRYLAAQFHDGLKSTKLIEVGVKSWEDGFGVTFNAIIPVKGLNGRTINIDTNWIMHPGQPPRLSTAVPAKKRDMAERQGSVPPVALRRLKGYQRWEAIYQLACEAAKAAAATTVPTPMRVEGYGIEMEGLCGYAWVRIRDARRGFARWLIANGHAHQHYRSGAQVFADVSSQSVDRARACATAFAAVLQHNGIECEVESRLD